MVRAKCLRTKNRLLHPPRNGKNAAADPIEGRGWSGANRSLETRKGCTRRVESPRLESWWWWWPSTTWRHTAARTAMTGAIRSNATHILYQFHAYNFTHTHGICSVFGDEQSLSCVVPFRLLLQHHLGVFHLTCLTDHQVCRWRQQQQEQPMPFGSVSWSFVIIASPHAQRRRIFVLLPKQNGCNTGGRQTLLYREPHADCSL